jgi:hypothetical protein
LIFDTEECVSAILLQLILLPFSAPVILVSPNVYPDSDVRTVGKAKKILEDVTRRLFHLKNSLNAPTANEDTRKWVVQEVQKVYPKGEVFHGSRTTTYEFGSI